LEKLSSAERWDRLYKGEALDRVPVLTYVDSIAARFCNTSTHDFYYYPQIAYENQKWFLKMFDSDDGVGFNIPCGYAADFPGGSVVIPEKPVHSIPRVASRAVKTLDDVEKLQLPSSLEQTFHARRILEFNRIRCEHGEGVSIFGGSPMGIAEGLVGIEKLYLWMIKEPQMVHRLMRFATDYMYLMARVHKEVFKGHPISAGINLPLESHTNISPRNFEKFSLPYIIEIMNTYKSMGINIGSIHLCGRHEKNLECIKSSLPFHGRTLVTVGSEMDMENLADVMGADFIIGGNLSNDVLMFGKPADVYKEAVNIIERMKYTPGGFVLTPECTVSCLVAPANIFAMTKAIQDKGCY